MPKVIVLKEHGTNCEIESAYAFQVAGADVDIVHMNELIEKPSQLQNYQILMLPGGFSHGDHTGSGKRWTNRLNHHLGDALREFIERDNLALGICNGFQVLVNYGLVPAWSQKYEQPQVALTHNESARYNCRWVDLSFQGESPWTVGIETMTVPIAHGEGKVIMPDETLAVVKQQGLVLAKYVQRDMHSHEQQPYNPNGSIADIAALTDPTGRIIGMMPHPERAIFPHQLPHWRNLQREGKLQKEGPGLQLFRNAVKHFE